MKTKYKPGDLVYDPRLYHGRVGMVTKITTDNTNIEDLWYWVMFFNDPLAIGGNARGYAVSIGDEVLKEYNPETQDEA